MDNDSKNNGGVTDYYQVFNGCVDVDDFCAKYNINFFIGNILKAAIRINTKEYAVLGGEIRDLNKIIHYAEKEKKRRLSDDVYGDQCKTCVGCDNSFDLPPDGRCATYKPGIQAKDDVVIMPKKKWPFK